MSKGLLEAMIMAQRLAAGSPDRLPNIFEVVDPVALRCRISKTFLSAEGVRREERKKAKA